ncbi:MAG: ZIP family metal transporter [Clostridia bacterium]|nr:ZIP family metal transporter [Clostridia bacterium]
MVFFYLQHECRNLNESPAVSVYHTIQQVIVLIVAGILIGFIGTAAGAAVVFFMKKGIGAASEKGLLGFAAGVMVAASVWSLLMPALESAAPPAWLLPTVGFLLGIGFLLVSEYAVERLRRGSRLQEDTFSKNTMLILAVTLHNIPEGLAVGVALAGACQSGTRQAMAAALILAAGIAIQNIPEGAIIALPLCGAGNSKVKAFCCGALSGAVEPVAAVLSFWMTAAVAKALPLLLSFAAGAMVYVCVNELIPEARGEGRAHSGVLGFVAGFLVMMILDVSLG